MTAASVRCVFCTFPTPPTDRLVVRGRGVCHVTCAMEKQLLKEVRRGR